MRKIEIVTNVYRKTGLSRQDTSTTIETFLEEIESCLKAGKSIYIRGFGTFMLKKRAKKIGRDIKNKKQLEIPEHYKPVFKPSNRLCIAVKRDNVIK